MQANLDELFRTLDAYAITHALSIPNPSSNAATRLSASLYLAHSTSDAKFSNICGTGCLDSAGRLAADSGRILPATCSEVLLGTADSVFFYVSPFRFPHTGCGILFAHSLETHHCHAGVATPFDSGGLVRHVLRPDPSEPPRDFLSRHQLPIPDHRRYLCLSMDVLFGKPEDYVEGVNPHHPGPLGLTNGDQRQWTHEVRIRERVFIRGSHLQAVFATRARVVADPEIESLFQWCARERVDFIAFDTPRGNDFEALRRECLAYIRRRLY